ncbi:MAG TPA: thioredoxin family protein [Nocardioides sp.]|uniref:thioredoxin family protein n=1 Tax=Nocardioides sp. TaxID=35761 RepID=UPI002C9294CC|nr:thioredoxin family protein [Nocardioides sp.]HQR28638.1 thioredoxin family protein [Nocardioides sp.]
MTARGRQQPLPRIAGLLLALLAGATLLLGGAAPAWSGERDGRSAVDRVATQETQVYYFYGDGCPVCAKATPFLEGLAESHPELRVNRFEVWHSAENRDLLGQMADAYRITPTGVPVIFIGRHAWVGFREGATDTAITSVVDACTTQGCPDPSTVELDGTEGTTTDTGQSCGTSPDGEPLACGSEDEAEEAIDVPLVGSVGLADRPLVVSTLLISFVDGVNPCSLWVLTVLIALSLRRASRRHTLVIGGTFILVTAAVYAMFIGGLFTVFTFVGFAPWIRVAVATVALFMALVSIKDYFWFKQGLSLTIPDSKKPGIYAGMRRVLDKGDSMPAMIGATAVLAAGVSLVEFGCTAGFPVLWTNLLQTQEAGPLTFALLLLLYMLIYQIDELVIFLTAVFTLRATRIQEKQGRLLKLGSGVLMLALALVMIIDPEIMSSVTGAVGVFLAAMAVSAIVVLVDRLVRPRST